MPDYTEAPFSFEEFEEQNGAPAEHDHDHEKGHS